MTTIATRFSITPSPAVEPVLIELARLLKRPKAAIVRELLDEAMPALQATLEAVRIAKSHPERAQALMAEFSARATRDLMQQQIEFSEAMKKRPGRKPGKKTGRGATKTG